MYFFILKWGGDVAKYADWITEDKLLLLESWARDGLLDEVIAKKIGISKTTLYDWKKKFPNFANALKKGQEVVDIEVENALLKRAKGYMTTETKTETLSDGKKRITTIEKEVPPDVTAQIYWLKNRQPQKWRDKPAEEKEITKIKVELVDNGSNT